MAIPHPISLDADNPASRGTASQPSRALYRGLLIVGTLMVAAAGFLAYSRVDNTLTADDRAAIASYLSGVAPLGTDAGYEEQLRFIRDVQASVLRIVADNVEIPQGQPREPSDLLLNRSGLCFDRSRVIEKVLRSAGFTTRHIALYSTAETGSALKSLLTPGVASHAITEVLTRKGWMVVGSNTPWLSLNEQRMPMSIEAIQRDARQASASIAWGANQPNPIYRAPFTFIYGLYSRHGKFFAPYNAVPDVAYEELVQNVW